MFLDRIRQRNPGLIRAATMLHQTGSIPANSWVIDLDVIAENAAILAESARANGLRTYVMTKQHGRNPFVTRVAMDRGLGAPVAVDVQCAKTLHRYGIPIGHIGHLNQIPKHEIMDGVKMRPEVFTVFNFEMAQAVSEAAARLGRVQAIMLRVVGKNDVFFEGQEGGIPEVDLDKTARRIGSLGNVEIVGTVSFPCIRYNPTPDIKVEPTPNMDTIVRAAEGLKKMGFGITQINAPGNTSSQTLEIIAKAGGTHAEPGHGLLGTTPNHAFLEGLPERPSYVYLSEISHYVGEKAYCFGGGFWQDIYNPNFIPRAVVGNDPETIVDRLVKAESKKQIIDYHGILESKEGLKIGDTVIFGFRTQMQMTRSQVAVLQGVQSGKPQVVGLFDHAGTMIDRDRVPVAISEVVKSIESVAKTYQTTG
jgi:predicted amino acid racemase